MRQWLRGLLWLAGILLVAGLLLHAFVVDIWVIPDDPVLGASLAPTLSDGDTVIVLKRGTPEFGDLVRCADIEDPTAFVVGRAAGFERDIVEILKPRGWIRGA